MKNTAHNPYIRLISKNDLDVDRIGVYGREHAMLCSSGATVQHVLCVEPDLLIASITSDIDFSNTIQAALLDVASANGERKQRGIERIQRMVERHRLSHESVVAIHDAYRVHMKRAWFWLHHGSSASTLLPEKLHQGEVVLIDSLRNTWSHMIGTMLASTSVKSLIDIRLEPLYIHIVRDFAASGVITTRGVDGEKDHIQMEVVPGIWMAEGTMKRDRYVWSRSSSEIVSRVISNETEAMLYNRHGSAQRRRVGSGRVLEDSTIELIAKNARAIHNYYLSPQRIHFYIDASGDIVVLHARHLEDVAVAREHEHTATEGILCTGISVVPGIVTGPVRAITSMHDLRKLASGEIAWIHVTLDISDSQLLSKALGVISPELDPMSRLGFLVRDAGIPTLFGVGISSVATGQVVTLDAISGRVLRPSTHTRVVPKDSATHVALASATRLYAYLHDVEQLHHPSIDAADAFVFSPHALLAQLGYGAHRYRTSATCRHEYEQLLHTTIATVIERVGQREVVLAASDLTTSQWRLFPDAHSYEPLEANSLLGYRGALRALASPELFETELKVIATLRHEDAHMLSLCIPYVRTVSELSQVKRIVVGAGLHRDAGFKLYATVATPSIVSHPTSLSHVGIDGLMLDVESLVSLYTGTDQRNSEMAPYIAPVNHEVSSYMQSVFESLAKESLELVVGSPLISHDADIVTAAIRSGVWGILVDPSTILHHRELVYTAERNTILG